MANILNIDALVAGQADIATLSLQQQIVAVRAMCVGSGRGPTKFAATLTCFLDATSQLSELDEASRHAAQVAKQEDSETTKWREISLSTMNFARSSLAEEQLRAIGLLEDLSCRGASIFQEAQGQNSDAPCRAASKMALQLSAAPCLSAPPGLSALPDCLPVSMPSLSRAKLLLLRPPVAMTKPKYRLKVVPAATVAAISNTEVKVGPANGKSQIVVDKQVVAGANKKLGLVVSSASDESDCQDVCSTRSPSCCLISDAYDSE